MGANWPAAFDAFRTLHLAETLDELTVVTPQDIGRNYLLHMSKNKDIKTMSPYVTTRTQKSEDRSVPRICMARDIAGCIVGYNTTVEDWQERSTCSDGNGQQTIPWVGGWYVYAIPFEYALRPSNKLVAAAGASDEHWLVTYGKETCSYKPILIGKLFYSAVTYSNVRQFKTTTIDMYLEHTSPIGIHFCPGLKLLAGYYHIRSDKLLGMPSIADVKVDQLQRLTKQQYDAVKMPIASLLSYSNAVREQHVPVMHW